jgi:hypothetical protein
MSLNNIVNVTVSRETASVSQAGFGTALILGSTASDLVKGGAPSVIESAADLLDLGFASSDDEYKAAAAYFGQTPKPSQAMVARMLDKVAQIVTITPVAVNLAVYTVTIDDVDYAFTADASATVAEIVSGLIALINADAACKVTASGTTTLILTADDAGYSFSVSLGTNLSKVVTAANVGVAESLAQISESAEGADDWYALIMTSKAVGDVMEAAAYIESLRKIFGTSSSSSGIAVAATTTDIVSKLKAKSYFRTFAIFSGNASAFPEAAMLGKFLPYTPGSEQWAFKTLVGITADVLTASQRAALIAKRANYYSKVAGNDVIQGGKVVGNEWIDTIRLIDLIVARTQEAIFSRLLRLPKIPFTNGGIGIVENEVKGVLSAQQKIGGIAPDEVDANGDLVPGFVTDFPLASEISANDKAARTLTGASATARLAGAIVAVNLNMTFTV